MRIKKTIKLNDNLFRINNIFPAKVANKFYSIFNKNSKWKRINQIRKNHYKTILKKKLDIWPTTKEIYYADFFRALNLEKDIYINNSIKKYIIPILKKKFNIINYEIRCHKFLPGHFLRAHFDHYISRVAVTVNLNKTWKADWGGLLCVINDQNKKITTLVPEWNSMNILISKNKKPSDRKSGHFVTSVEKYACENRFSITIFSR